jgi:hypothetical protein
MFLLGCKGAFGLARAFCVVYEGGNEARKTEPGKGSGTGSKGRPGVLYEISIVHASVSSSPWRSIPDQ